MTLKILILVVVLLLFVVFLFYAIKSLRKKLKDYDEDKPKDKNLVYLSSKGSLIFYVLLLLIFTFFLIMYIMWKTQ